MKKPVNIPTLVAGSVRLNRRGQAVLVDPVSGEQVVLATEISGRNIKLVEDVRSVIGKIVARALGSDPANSAYEAELVRRVKIAGFDPQSDPKENLKVLRSLGLPAPRHADFRKKRHMSEVEKARFGKIVRKFRAGVQFPCGHPRDGANTVRSAAGRAKCATCNSPILQH